jgi:hypothetical protein
MASLNQILPSGIIGASLESINESRAGYDCDLAAEFIGVCWLARLQRSLSNKFGGDRLKFRDSSKCRQAFDNITASSDRLVRLSIEHDQTVKLRVVGPGSPIFSAFL